MNTSSSWTFKLCTLLWGKNKIYIRGTSGPQNQLFCCTLFVPIWVHYFLFEVHPNRHIFLWCKYMCILKLPKYDSRWDNSGDLSQICLSLPHSVFYLIRRFCWKIKYMHTCVYIYVCFQDTFFQPLSDIPLTHSLSKSMHPTVSFSRIWHHLSKSLCIINRFQLCQEEKYYPHSTDWKLKHHWVYMIHLRLNRSCLK